MRLNEHTAVSASNVLLVPYDARHVLKYHEWMSDPAIREATASDELTLEEEFENQQSWRTSHDKLTFIICTPADGHDHRELASVKDGRVFAGHVDTPDRMVGDINLFLTPWEDDEDQVEAIDETHSNPTDGTLQGACDHASSYCSAEIDIMIADKANRRRGLGRAAVATFLRFIRGNIDMILREYGSTEEKPGMGLKNLVVKIHAENEGSIALFKGLGFQQKGEINYFGEIQMVLDGFGAGDGQDDISWALKGTTEYVEVIYDRSRVG
ncbi:acetyltransferase domain-containing protein [Xylariaceae sp. FL0016]|nr:acetyltransferase domain-containing protein [Xylariaceae sp. FL0016]